MPSRRSGVPLRALLFLIAIFPHEVAVRGGDTKPRAIFPADDVVFSDPARRAHAEVETTAALIPGTANEAGHCFVESGRTLWSRAFSASGGIGDLVPASPPPLVAPESLLAIDHMLVRLKGGELLLLRQSRTAADVTAPPSSEASFSLWKD